MGKLRLSGKERFRLEVLSKVRKGGINLAKVAELLSLSYRQVLRIWQRFAAEGSMGLKHGLRDRSSNRQIEPGRRERVLELYQAKYEDFGPGPTHQTIDTTISNMVSYGKLGREIFGVGRWRRLGRQDEGGAWMPMRRVSWQA